jgi:hypothetical protein
VQQGDSDNRYKGKGHDAKADPVKHHARSETDVSASILLPDDIA